MHLHSLEPNPEPVCRVAHAVCSLCQPPVLGPALEPPAMQTLQQGWHTLPHGTREHAAHGLPPNQPGALALRHPDLVSRPAKQIVGPMSLMSLN